MSSIVYPSLSRSTGTFPKQKIVIEPKDNPLQYWFLQSQALSSHILSLKILEKVQRQSFIPCATFVADLSTIHMFKTRSISLLTTSATPTFSHPLVIYGLLTKGRSRQLDIGQVLFPHETQDKLWILVYIAITF